VKVAVPESVLAAELSGEGVLLELQSGEYFALDQVAMDMWKALGKAGTVEGARAALLAEYEVATETLASDLDAFVGTLAQSNLIVITP
jgi:DNA-binding SARP family transcriptional activator